MKNTCKHIEPLLNDYILERVDPSTTLEIEGHLAHCDTCSKALEEYTFLSNAFSKTPEMVPPQALAQHFEAMLLKEKATQEPVISLTNSSYTWKSALRIAAGIALIATSFFIGNSLQKTTGDDQLVTTEKRYNSKEQLASILLIENRSASKRVQGVYNIEDFSEVNSEIITALIK